MKKISSKKTQNFLVKAFAIMLLLVANNACATNLSDRKSDLLTTPARLPFDITKKGNKVEMLVKIKKRDSYITQLEFHFDDPRFTEDQRKNRRLFPSAWHSWAAWIKVMIFGFDNKEYSKEEMEVLMKDRDRVKRLTGTHEYQDPETHKRCDLPLKITCEQVFYKAVPTPIHLKITKLEKNGLEKILFDEVVENPEKKELHTNKCGRFSCEHNIETMILDAGIYRFSAEALRDSPELIGTQIMLGVESTSKGKV